MITPRVISLDLDDTLWPVAPAIAAAETALLSWLRARHPRAAHGHDLDSMRALRARVAARFPEQSHDLTFLRRRALVEQFAAAGYADARTTDAAVDVAAVDVAAADVAAVDVAAAAVAAADVAAADVAAADVAAAAVAEVEPSAACIDEALEIFFAERNRVRLYEDARPALLRLRSKYRLFALSNGNADLKRCGVADLFDGHITASAAGAAKPDARIFTHLLRAANVTPMEVLHIGDDPLADVVGATRAGMQAVWLNRDAREWPPQFGAPLRTISTLAAIE